MLSLKRIATSSALALCLSLPAMAQQQKPADPTETAPSGTMKPADDAMKAGERGVQSGTDAATQSGANVTTSPNQSLEPVTEQKPTQFLAEKLIGSSVFNDSDESIGTIEDLAVSDAGKIESVVVSVGGFLGIGSKEVGLPWDSLKREQFEGGMILRASTTTEELKEMPEFRSVDDLKSEAAAEDARRSTGVNPALPGGATSPK